MNQLPNKEHPLKFQVRHQKQTDAEFVIESARFMLNYDMAFAIFVTSISLALLLYLAGILLFSLGTNTSNQAGISFIFLLGVVSILIYYFTSRIPLRHTINIDLINREISIHSVYVRYNRHGVETITKKISHTEIESIEHQIMVDQTGLINNCAQINLQKSEPIQLCFGINPAGAKAMSKTLDSLLLVPAKATETKEANTTPEPPNLVQVAIKSIEDYAQGGALWLFILAVSGYFFIPEIEFSLSRASLILVTSTLIYALRRGHAILPVITVLSFWLTLTHSYENLAIILVYIVFYVTIPVSITWWSVQQVKTKYADPKSFHNSTTAITQWLFPLLGFGFTAASLLTLTLLPQATPFINPFDLTVFGFAFSLAALLSDHKMKPLSYLSTTAALTLFALQFFV